VRAVTPSKREELKAGRGEPHRPLRPSLPCHARPAPAQLGVKLSRPSLSLADPGVGEKSLRRWFPLESPAGPGDLCLQLGRPRGSAEVLLALARA